MQGTRASYRTGKKMKTQQVQILQQIFGQNLANSVLHLNN